VGDSAFSSNAANKHALHLRRAHRVRWPIVRVITGRNVITESKTTLFAALFEVPRIFFSRDLGGRARAFFHL
jgi:hypothetical protein